MLAVQRHQRGLGCIGRSGDQCIGQSASMAADIVTPPQPCLDGDYGIDNKNVEGGDERIQARSLFAITYAEVKLGHADGR